MANTLASRAYAQAYVSALPENTDAVRELGNAFDVIGSVTEVRSYLSDPSISADDKKKALTIALPDASEETKNFVLLLSANSDLDRGESILNAVKQAYAEREQRTYAEVMSAVPLTTDEVQRIAAALAVKTGHPVLLEPIVNEAIKGGIKVRIGDWVFDATLTGRLQRLKQSLHV